MPPEKSRTRHPDRPRHPSYTTKTDATLLVADPLPLRVRFQSASSPRRLAQLLWRRMGVVGSRGPCLLVAQRRRHLPCGHAVAAGRGCACPADHVRVGFRDAWMLLARDVAVLGHDALDVALRHRMHRPVGHGVDQGGRRIAIAPMISFQVGAQMSVRPARQPDAALPATLAVDQDRRRCAVWQDEVAQRHAHELCGPHRGVEQQDEDEAVSVADARALGGVEERREVACLDDGALPLRRGQRWHLARRKPDRYQRRIAVGCVAEVGPDGREPRVHGAVRESRRPLHVLRPPQQELVGAQPEREAPRGDRELARHVIVQGAQSQLVRLACVLAPAGLPDQVHLEEVVGPREEELAVARLDPASTFAHSPPPGWPTSR